MTDRLVATLGADPANLEVAYASEHGARFFQTYALRLRGVSGSGMLEAFLTATYDPAEGDVTHSDSTVNGIPVTVVAQPTTIARLGTYYAYPYRDVLLVVQAFDPRVAEQVLQALPSP